MMSLFNQLWLKKNISVAENVFPESYLNEVRTEILNAAYLSNNPLNKLFSTTSGFSVIFKRKSINKAIQRFPWIESYLNRVAPSPINAFYLNPLVMTLNSKVERHVEQSLRSFYQPMPFPVQTSVLYVDVPDMAGGELAVYRNDRLITRIKPEKNKLIIFKKDLKHEVTEITALYSPQKQYRISLVCEQYILREKVLKEIPDFLIRSTVNFDKFLQMEKS